MKAKISALNKNYLVEFKDDSEFLSFLTQHNDKISDVEVINEEALPELQKPVSIVKPSLSDGWKTLEKSAFTQKEKNVEKKGMTLGGKYAEFKYEPDKNLTNSTDDKVSTPKNDSPALTGSEPKAANVEATAKENEVKNDSPKADTPKEEKSKSEPAKEESPKTEEKKEEPKEKKSEKKEEVKESVEDDFDDESYEDEGFQVWVKDDSNYTECVSIEESEEAAIEEAKRIYDESEDKNIVVFVNDAASGNTIFSTKDNKEEIKEANDESLTEEQIEDVKEYFKDICGDKEAYPDYEEMVQAMRSLDSNGAITHGQYNYCLAHWDEWLSEFDREEDDAKAVDNTESDGSDYDEELDEVFKAAGLEEGWKDTARNFVAGAAMTAAVAGANPATAANNTELKIDPVQIEQAIQKQGQWTEFNFINGEGKPDTMKIKYNGNGEFEDEYEHTMDKYDLKALQKGEDIGGV